MTLEIRAPTGRPGCKATKYPFGKAGAWRFFTSHTSRIFPRPFFPKPGYFLAMMDSRSWESGGAESIFTSHTVFF